MDPTDWQYTHQIQWKSPRRRTDSRDLSGKVDMYSVRNTLPFMNTGEKDVGFPSSTKCSSAYNNINRPLKERVNGIMQRRLPDGQWRKATTAFSTPTDHLPPPNPVEKTSSSTLNKDDHPLKLRVKALMNRHRDSGLLDSHGEIPVKPQPPSQSPTTTVEEKNSTVEGFQRFLSVLNKGVDIEMLNRILIDDNEHPPTGQGLLQSHTPVVKEKSGVCESDSQRLQCGAGQRDRRSGSAERTTELLNQHISNEACKRNIQREEKSAQSDNGGDYHFVSSRRSMSPPVVEEKKPKLEQHQGDLQNILKAIGFSMDADDMCKLEERTQKRLYGMKNETELRSDATALSKRSQQHVRSDHSRSSSSVSDRPSSSPSRHQHSPSKTSRDSRKQTQCSEYGLHFRQRSRERGSREQRRKRDGEKNIIASRDGSTGRHQYLENPEYIVTYPDAACAIPMYNSDATSAIPSYTSVQHSEYSAYHSDTSNCVSLNYGSNDIPPPSSSYPPAFCNDSMTPLCPSADTGALDVHVYPHTYIHPYPPAGCNTALGHSYFNTDLSLTETEGQTGQKSAIHVINFLQRRYQHISQKDKARKLIARVNKPVSSDQITGEKQAGVERTPSNSNLSLSEGQTGQQSTANTVTKAEQKEGQIESQSPFFWLKEQLKYVRKHAETKAKCSPKNNFEWLQKQLQYILKRLEQNSHSLSEGQTGQQSAVNTVTKAEFQMEEKKMAEKKEGQKESYISIQRLVMEIDYIRCLLPVGIDQGYTLLKDELKCVRIALANCDLPKHNPEWLRKQLAAKEQYILMILNPNADLSLSEGQTGQKWTEMAVNTVTKSEQKEGQIGSQRSIQGQQLEGDSGCPDYIPHIHSYTPGLLPVGKVGPFFWLKEQLKYVRKETETQVKCNHRGSGYTLWGSQFRRNSEWLRKQLAAKEQYILKILRTQTCQQLEVD